MSRGCSCRKGCKTKQCGCRKKSRTSGPGCECTGCINTHQLQTHPSTQPLVESSEESPSDSAERETCSEAEEVNAEVAFTNLDFEDTKNTFIIFNQSFHVHFLCTPLVTPSFIIFIQSVQVQICNRKTNRYVAIATVAMRTHTIPLEHSRGRKATGITQEKLTLNKLIK